jgi:hypothetical protein
MKLFPNWALLYDLNLFGVKTEFFNSLFCIGKWLDRKNPAKYKPYSHYPSD